MSGYYEPPFDPAAPQYDTAEPPSPLDRIEGQARGVTADDNDVVMERVTLSGFDVLALVEIARAAQALDAKAADLTWPDELLTLRAALARLNQDTT